MDVEPRERSAGIQAADVDTVHAAPDLEVAPAQQAALPEQALLARLTATFRQALASQQGGNLEQARVLFGEILSVCPRHFDSLYLMGLIAAQTGDPRRAAEWLGEALEVDPRHAPAHCNRGAALHELGELDAALAGYEAALVLNPDYARAHLNRANVLSSRGQWPMALESYDRALALDGELHEAHMQRGSALRALGQHEAALASYDRAVASKPDHALAWFKRGLLLKELGRLEAALASYDAAIAIDAEFAEAHSNRGNVLLALEQWDAALASYESAIASRPDYADAHCNLGKLFLERRQWDAALASCERAIAIKRDHAEAHFNRAVALEELENLDAALAGYDEAIAIKSDYAEAHCNRGNVLHEFDRLEEALASYETAILVRPDFAEGYCNRGNVLQELRNWDGALASFDKAIALKADFAEAHSNHGNVLAALHRPDAALASYDRAIASKSDYAEAYFNRALARLSGGDFERGLADYEWRWKHPGSTHFKDPRTWSQPSWLGRESLAGKSILLHSEQGLGDTLQFCRYVKKVAALGARTILDVQPPLRSLLAGLEGVSHLVTAEAPRPEFDHHCPLLSLPLAFNTDLDTIPGAVPYLKSDPLKTAQWEAKLGARTLPRIGIVWSGNPDHKNDRNRSILLADLIRHLPAGFRYVSLQKEVRERDRPALAANPGILDPAAELEDFSDTAALGECLDLVISTDTSVAHLVAALNRPTWILLPFNPDWRWLMDREDSPWYPSVTLYRQESLGDWMSVLERVGADLERTFR
jgi:tetratricopeptide (TPR) repeat protein